MVLFLEVLDGLKQGSRFKLVPGQVIGRNDGDIIIEDQKISGRHAQIEVDNKEQLILSDLDSSNGILAGNRRVKKLAMMPGVVFKLGRTSFKVVQIAETPSVDFARVRTWRENLAEALPIDWVQNKLFEGAGRTFSPNLSLKFIQGIQADETVFITYGPRRLGSHSLDIDLKEPDAPALAFELTPGKTGEAILTNHSKNKLTINNQSVHNETPLQEGDLIRLGGTIIQVAYV